MTPLREHLQREVASLLSFVESVSHACNPTPQSVAYPEASTRFFDYVTLLAERTKQHIVGFEHHADDSDDDFQEARGELWTLRDAWHLIHQLIKPSADADTLNQPTALVRALVSRIREVKGFENTDFAIFHTNAFNYSQLNPSATETALTQLARILETKEFPSDLGLIGIPNSQGRALFLNCLIGHEVGEYVYAKKDIERILAPVAALALAKHIGTKYDESPETVRSSMANTVILWAKELFCDLFAVRLLGPCYAFAYVELFDIANLLSKDGSQIVSDADMQPQINFYREYPSHPFRARAQSELLKEEGWWDFLKDMNSRRCGVLRALLDVKPERFLEAESAQSAGRTPFVQALFDLLPEIKKQLGFITDGVDSRLHEYGQLSRHIAEYLENGLVPSTLTSEVSPNNYRKVHPTPITLLNAAYGFYLERIERLMSRIEDQALASPQDRAYWMKRVEEWTSKALEDVALITGRAS